MNDLFEINKLNYNIRKLLIYSYKNLKKIEIEKSMKFAILSLLALAANSYTVNYQDPNYIKNGNFL